MEENVSGCFFLNTVYIWVMTLTFLSRDVIRHVIIRIPICHFLSLTPDSEILCPKRHVPIGTMLNRHCACAISCGMHPYVKFKYIFQFLAPTLPIAYSYWCCSSLGSDELHSAHTMTAQHSWRGRAAPAHPGRVGWSYISVWSAVQSVNGARDCKPALQLMENISNINCEHAHTNNMTANNCFASCVNKAYLFDY